MSDQDRPGDEPGADDPRPAEGNPPADGVTPPARLMPPIRSVERSQAAEDFITHTPQQPRPADVPEQPARREALPASDEAPTIAEAGAPGDAPLPAVRPDPEPPAPAYDPELIGGLGDPPEEPMVALPPIEEAIAGYPLSPRTGEPQRNWVVIAAVASFAASALVSGAAYWWYWWTAINMTDFSTSARLIELFDPRPGSGSSVVLVCVLAVIGAIMAAGPAVAGYNTWHGAAISRATGLAACATSLLAFFVIDVAWLALPLAAIGTGLLWTRPARAFLKAWDEYANPARRPVEPYREVAYGPAPRFR